MGFFKDLRQVDAAGRKNFDRMQAEMADLNLVTPDEARAPSISPDDAVNATATVVRFAQTNTVANLDPVIELDLVVLAPGTAPRPVTIRASLSLGQTGHVQRGASIAVTVSRSDPTLAAIDWPSSA